MATLDLKVRLIPDARELRKSIRDAQKGAFTPAARTGEGGGASFAGEVKVKGFGALLGKIGIVAAILEALDSIIRPILQLIKLLVMVLLLPFLPFLKSMLKLFADGIKLFAVYQKGQMKEAEETPFGLGAFDAFKPFFGGLFDIEGLKTQFKNFIDALKGVTDETNSGAEKIKEGGMSIEENTKLGKETFFKTIQDWLNNTKTRLIEAREKTRAFFDNLWNNIGVIIANWWENIKTAWNNLIDDLKEGFRNILNGLIRLYNKIPILPDIPYLAEGGIVKKPTLAMIGEKGPEAVIPLNRNNPMGNITITINNPSVRQESDIRRIAEEVSRVLAVQNRRMFS